ncbi:hypothetical protein V2J09_022861 [Rumex salicifolius]
MIYFFGDWLWLRYTLMQPIDVEASNRVKKEGRDFADKGNNFASPALHGTRDLIHEHVVISLDEDEDEDEEGDRIPNLMVNNGESCNASKQLVMHEIKAHVSYKPTACDPVSDNRSSSVSKELVLYDPRANVTHESILAPDPLHCHLPVARGSAGGSNMPSRVLPSVGAYTVQCAECFKWRLIPTKAKYEEIREYILDQPFVCDAAREWKPDISCDEPPDIQQDGSRLWAIDKPSIAQSPPGWERELRIRGEGGSKFADVGNSDRVLYYIAPSGKKLRSMVEVQKYLLEHPEHIEEGVKTSQFSFQIPKPLQENYVRKRPRITSSFNDFTSTPRALEPNGASPLPLGGPTSPVLRLHGPDDANSPETPISSETRALKQQKKTHSPTPSNERLHNRFKIKIGQTRPPTNTNDTV